MKRVSVFGATGSIGQNTLDLIRRDPDGFDVSVLTGASNIDQLSKDALEFRPDHVVTANDGAYKTLKDNLEGTGITVSAGHAAIADAADVRADWVMSAIVGAAGLIPSLGAARQGATLALANKETMVCAGALILEIAQQNKAEILPVDSEHSAVFQALIGEEISAVDQVVLTASGGAFRDWPIEKLAHATPQEAATHPNWDMGQRITIDSASMFNKALELIEAKELFGLRPDQISAVLHPQSMVHALVGFHDGAFMAHVGPPDMRHAIGFAMYHPNRTSLPVEKLNIAQLGRLEFSEIDETRFPAIPLARHVMNQGGLWGAAFNAAKEIALDRFIACDIGFLQMAQLVEKTLNKLDHENAFDDTTVTLDNVLGIDHLARQMARATPLT